MALESAIFSDGDGYGLQCDVSAAQRSSLDYAIAGMRDKEKRIFFPNEMPKNEVALLFSERSAQNQAA
jgi:hypothetical protein